MTESRKTDTGKSTWNCVVYNGCMKFFLIKVEKICDALADEF